jgi:hypothetical protein
VFLFAFLVAFPRFAAISPGIPAAVYDDQWHLQKIVSVFGTFPDFKHYLFPGLKFSYYFYAYIIPAVAYTLKTGLNLKMVWAFYIFAAAISLSTLLLLCFNAFLPASGKVRTVFALSITFMGGLHEWPYVFYAWFTGLKNWHTEWWAKDIGLNMQVSSFYSTHFWAPQHVCGLAIFGLIFYMLQKMESKKKAGFACGLLLGIQAGFSVYVAIFSLLYILLYILFRLWKQWKEYVSMGTFLFAGMCITLLPIFKYFIDKEGTIFFVGDVLLIPHYVLFLVVEFGAMLVLFYFYGLGVFGAEDRMDRDGRIHVVFIIVTFVLLFCFQSKGFNVLSYRSILPAQILFYFSGSLMIDRLKNKSYFLKYAVMVLLCIQMAGFIPEMLAMTKKNIDCRKSTFRLPDNIVRINAQAPFTEIFTIPYKDVDSITLNISIHNIFRLKDVSERFFCEGKVDTNNMVYLSNKGIETIKRACRRGADIKKD